MKWIVCDRVIEKFKIQNLKAVQRESWKSWLTSNMYLLFNQLDWEII